MASVSSGIRRKVDDLGRVVIPAGIRRSLNIREGDAVEVSVDGERIVLAKPRDACVFCGREGDDLHRFRSRLVCRECVATIGQADDQLRTAATTPGQPTGPFRPAPQPTSPDAEVRAGRRTGALGKGPGNRGDGGTEVPRSDPTADERSDQVADVDWPTGPIDGDAFAREVARRAGAPQPADRAEPADVSDEFDEHVTDRHGGDADPERTTTPGRGTDADGDAARMPPYDPSSTTAW